MGQQNYLEDYLKQRQRVLIVMSIVIPTRELVADLNKDLGDAEHLYPDIDVIFDHLMNILALKSNVKWRLNKERERFIEVVDSIEPSQSKVVAESFFNIGNRLFQLLDQHNAYESGFLIYQKHKWIGTDLILRKLTKDELPEII